MDLTDAELDALLETAHHDLLRVVSQTGDAEDWTLHQLSVLCTTYPLWWIQRGSDATGQMWWAARLRYEVSPAMAATGVSQEVKEADAIALAAVLAWQTYLFNCWRARTG
ncbi:hypothetical protein SAMN05444920_104545 [Nonomuraea solani]|uniref:Uncharacterized protein n=1 Tax=Nonomuraea solani TaxID=1144553 RepID=A0A1H6CY30_9ACTN|nr:hypothetical protein [Nonomuraea solani]SEG77932.1 hypothetical protein SAMN05444920_104545 [Nonomuraea solani]